MADIACILWRCRLCDDVWLPLPQLFAHLMRVHEWDRDAETARAHRIDRIQQGETNRRKVEARNQ